MKKRTIALMLSVLAVMMLVGVGFATWVISQGDSKEVPGSLVVETVKDNRLNVSVTAVKSGNYEHTTTHNVITADAYASLDASEQANYQLLDDGNKLNFTAPATATTGWLTAEDGHNIEKKTMTFTVSVTKQDGSIFEENPVIKYQLSADLISKAGLVQLDDDLTLHTVAASDITLSGDKKTATCTITVSYKWGYVFNEQNPYEFFNSKEVDAALTPTDVENAGSSKANLTYNSAALTVANNYGDLAHAALEALYLQQGQTVKATISVDL